ncbi:hypothetical protein CspeluHIS016_0601600 [Cutaneotrichosporon spelunceum]|uniref:MATE efflux family protein n=1 Tax=Cutaneotrichosporon spelunceum TaxID=1672016 RepID=A0AAD3YE27_9TREE|nr:hypothetical protein CspeluHIS016_0601600 [Cutaneotrichosporon spelunceum]
MTSPISGSRMMPSVAARASFSPVPVTSAAAVKHNDREERHAGSSGVSLGASLGRRISADFSAEPFRSRRMSRGMGAPIAPSAGASERTPLLGAMAPANVDDNDDICDDEASAARHGNIIESKGRFHGLPGMNRPATVWNEFRVLVATSLPLCMGLMLENALNTINVLVCSRLGSAELAVSGNSSLLVMVTGYPIPLAIAAAFTTLSAPLYAQVDARHHIGHWLQRGAILSVVLSIPIMIFWWNISKFLLALKQPPELVAGMETYMRASITILPGLGLVECMKSYLQVQGIMTPPPLILLGLLPLHLALAIYLVHYTSIGAPGAALATAVTLSTAGLLLVILALRTRARECFDGLSKKSFTDWYTVIKLAVPGALMFGSELWAFQIIALLAGRLGKDSVAAQAVIATLDALVAMVPYAISIAIANRVGNLLGHGTRGIPRARKTVGAGLLLEVLVSGSTGLSVLIFRYQLARLLTKDEAVVSIAAKAAIFVASYQIFDGLQNVGAACLRAFGRQTTGSIIHFVGYYIIGLPIGAYLGLGPPGWGLSGLWAGAALSLACTAAAELAVALTIKWEHEVERVQLREEDMSDSEDSDDDIV